MPLERGWKGGGEGWEGGEEGVHTRSKTLNVPAAMLRSWLAFEVPLQERCL